MILVNEIKKYLIKDNSLSSEEITHLTSVAQNFNASSTPSKEERNYYYRQFIDSTNLDSFFKLSTNAFSSFYSNKVTLLPDGVWINKVTNQTNLEDKHHTDISALSSVTFFDTDFKGGELEIIPEKNGKILITPKIGRTLFFTGNTISHKVLPVTSGNRYTLIVFWTVQEKEEHTLI